jgi:hypothetical protein
LPSRVDHDRNCIVVDRCDAADPRDKRFALHSLLAEIHGVRFTGDAKDIRPQIDVVGAGGAITPRLAPYADIVAAVIVLERGETDGRVAAARAVPVIVLTPITVLSEPVVLLFSEKYPLAVLLSPVVLKLMEKWPGAVLPPPVVLRKSAFTPSAVLLLPWVLNTSAVLPSAVLESPDVLLVSD